MSQLLRNKVQHASSDDPDYTELVSYADLDALFELYGHIRASNPTSEVRLRSWSRLSSDDYRGHLIALGGIDYNAIAREALEEVHLPVRQVADWTTQGELYFEADVQGETSRFHPILHRSGEHMMLREDVGLFARAPSPYYHECTITLCNGMYSRGTLGVVRAFTDARVRDRNAKYISAQLGDNDTYCLLMRIRIFNGRAIAPDWELSDDLLYAWFG